MKQLVLSLWNFWSLWFSLNFRTLRTVFLFLRVWLNRDQIRYELPLLTQTGTVSQSLSFSPALPSRFSLSHVSLSHSSWKAFNATSHAPHSFTHSLLPVSSITSTQPHQSFPFIPLLTHSLTFSQVHSSIHLPVHPSTHPLTPTHIQRTTHSLPHSPSLSRIRTPTPTRPLSNVPTLSLTPRLSSKTLSDCKV